MQILWWTLLVIAIVVVLVIAQAIYLTWVLKWEDENSVGLNYYGLSAEGRAKFRRALRRHAVLLAPMLALNRRIARLDFRKARIVYSGVSAPPGSCSVESFARAEAYRPTARDIFVVTQMKCGTTWMENIVYEVLHRGHGTLVETGSEMYALAPWLEGRRSVPIEQAHLLGVERPSHIIKTHLPVQLCPWNAEARYIYVARHPVSCYASCVDFVVTNVGGMAPAPGAFEEWFCSPDLMWWGTWTDHVKGWWERSRESDSVLFVFFEDMKKDLAGIVRQVAAFLGVPPLSEEELSRVVHKCGFAYMQEHQDNFEMHPPHILQVNAELFVSGSAERHKDVPNETKARILAWAARELKPSDFPAARKYPDVAAAGG